MAEAEEVEINTMVNPCTNTPQLAGELHQQGDETKITVLRAELANVVSESSAITMLEHGETELKETTLVDAGTVFGAEEAETTTSVDLVTDDTLQLSDELHQRDDETEIDAPSNELTKETSLVDPITIEAENVETTISVDLVTDDTLQLSDELHQCDNETEFSVASTEITKETTLVDPITIEAEKVETTISVDLVTDDTLQLSDEVHQREDETEISVPSTELTKETSLVDPMTIEAEKVGTTTSVDLVTDNTLQLSDEVHQRGNQTDISVPSTKLTEETTLVDPMTIEAEKVETTILVDLVTDDTLQLSDELHQRDNGTEISVPFTELTKETTLVDPMIIEAEKVETTTSVDLVTDNPQQLLDNMHQQDDETEISVPSTKLMDVVETKNNLSMEEANHGLQQVEELHGLSSQVGVNEETTFVNDKTMWEAEDVVNPTVIKQCSNTLQFVEELDQQGDETKLAVLHAESSAKTILVRVEAEITKETTLIDAKTVFGAEEVEINTSIDQATNNTLQLLDELHEHDDESGISAPSIKVSNKVNELDAEHVEMGNRTSSYQATNPGKLAEELPQKLSESKLTICSVDIGQKLSVKEGKLLPDDEHENIILIDLNDDDLQIVGELRQDCDSRLRDESVTATVKPRLNNDGIENPISTGQATNDPHLAGGLSQQGHEPETGTVSNIEVLAEEMKATIETHMDSVEFDDQKHEKTNMNEKKIKIAEELKSINLEMDEKLKKIEELADHVLAIDTEISQIEFQCSESKGRHADFIDLYKFMVESQLPLRSHREIRLFMKKMDKTAQQLMSSALDLQLSIEARTKLKLSLQKEREELGKLVEAQKLQVQQKLNELTVVKFEEAFQSSETATNGLRKRKADHQEDLVGELCAPSQAKRMAFEVVNV